MQLGAGASSHVHTDGPPSVGPITYRHVLSAGTLTPTNPLRVIAHCDVDAAYAAFEAKRLGLDPHKVPIAVQQWNGLIAISYAARKYGITRHETIDDAKKKCPELILAHVATYAEGADHAEYNDDPRPETHKVSLDPYRRESKKILDIFKKTCPAGAVEKASIDESFFDLTIEVRKALLEAYPELRAPPEDASTGLDTPLPCPPKDALALWAGLGNLIPVHGDVGEGQDVNTATRKAQALKRRARLAKGSRTMAPGFDSGPESRALVEAARAGGEAENAVVMDGQGGTTLADAVAAVTEAQEPTPPSAQVGPEPEPANGEREGEAIDSDKVGADAETEQILDTEDVAITWQDVALAMGAKLMAKVRAAVRDELGYTTSAGIASNKTMAKLCSGWRKPNAQTIMRPAAVRNFLKVLPFQKIRFLGGKLGDALANEWQSATVGDLWSVTLEQMQAKFGEDSGWVYNVLRGIDYSEVRERVANKTMLASKNVRPIITKWSQGMHWLGILSTELSVRLAEARETEPNLWPRTIVLRYLRIGDTARSRQAAFAYARELSADVVRRAAERLWRDAFGDLARSFGGGGGGVSPTKIGSGNGSSGSAANSANEFETRELRPGIVTIALGFSGLEKAAETGQRRIDDAFFVKGGAGYGSNAAFSKRADPPTSTEDATSSAGAGPSSPSRDRLVENHGDGPSSPSSAAARQEPTNGVKDGIALDLPPRKKQKRLGPLKAMLQTQQHKQSSSADGGPDGVSGTKSRPDDDALVATATTRRDSETRPPPSKAPPSWSCPKCGEVLRPPWEWPTPSLPEADVISSSDALRNGTKGRVKALWPFDEEDGGGGGGNVVSAETALLSELPISTSRPDNNSSNHEALIAQAEAEAWLQAARTAHEDEHFARQLQEEEDRRNRTLVGSQAYAAAQAAAASSSSASGSGSSSARKGKGGGGSKGGSASNKAPRSSGSIASFFSQTQPGRRS